MRTAARLAHRRPQAIRRSLALGLGLALALGSVGIVAAGSPPANDAVAGATALALDNPIDFDSSDATTAPTDPTDCNGSHGSYPGPYFASVWFSYTAKSAGQLNLSAPTMQGRATDFLAISFVYEQTAAGLQLVDCTAYGNDATWRAKAGSTYLIAEAGMSHDTTGDPDFSDRGGTGTIVISRTANAAHYAWTDRSTNADCGFPVEVVAHGDGMSHLLPGRHGDPTPYTFDNYHNVFVTTNPANGKWFTEEGNGVYRDLHITNVSGTIYTFVAQETGRPYTLTDMHGNKVYFDRGRLVRQFQVDTKGDADLSNDEFIDGSFQIIADDGSHEGFYIEDFCAVVQQLLG
jgi:hypothetical protein